MPGWLLRILLRIWTGISRWITPPSKGLPSLSNLTANLNPKLLKSTLYEIQLRNKSWKVGISNVFFVSFSSHCFATFTFVSSTDFNSVKTFALIHILFHFIKPTWCFFDPSIYIQIIILWRVWIYLMKRGLEISRTSHGWMDEDALTQYYLTHFPLLLFDPPISSKVMGIHVWSRKCQNNKHYCNRQNHSINQKFFINCSLHVVLLYRMDTCLYIT